MKAKLTPFDAKELVLEKVAIAKLKNKKLKVTYDRVIAESGRIERVAESFFVKSKDCEYNKFVINWIKENIDAVLFTETYDYDILIPDEEFYENELERYF